MKRTLAVNGNFSRRCAALLAALCIAAGPGGCGGGSAGTGGQLFDGSVVDSRSQPLSNVAVTLSATQLTSVTGADGRFSLETAPLSGDIDFTLSQNGNTATTKITDVPGDAEHIAVTFEFEPEKSSARPIAVDVQESSSSSSSRPGSSSSSAHSSSSSSSSDDGGASSSEGGSASSEDHGGQSSSSGGDGEHSSDSSSSHSESEDGGDHHGGSSSSSSSSDGSGGHLRER